MTAKRVLVVDDNDLVRLAVAAMVKECGHYAVEAHNVAAALAASQGEPVDLVITDNCMPLPGDGIEVIQYFNRQRGQSLPIILHSSDVPHDLNTLLDVFPQVTFVMKANSAQSTLMDTIREKLPL